MQRSSSTYCDEPADSDDYQAWLQVAHRCSQMGGLSKFGRTVV